MKIAEHLQKFNAGDYSPRIVETFHGVTRETCYVAWTPTWEGPPRPDYPAAAADLRGRIDRGA